MARRWSALWVLMGVLGCGTTVVGGGGTTDTGSTGSGGSSTTATIETSSGLDDTGTAGTMGGSSDADGGSSTTARPPGPTVHIVSFNLLHGFPGFADLDARTAIVVDWINEHQPDAIALQEVGQTPMLSNRAEILAGMTGYEWAWAQASGIELLFEEGPGVLSRWPITWVDDVMLPHPGMGGFEIRRTIGVGIDTPHGELAVFSAHLTTQDDEVVSADQALTAYEFVKANTGPLGGFFAGDMNAEPDTLAMRMLRGEMGHQGVLGDLTDAWLDVWPKLDGFTSPSDAPEHRIDYVYVVPGDLGVGTVLGCALILGEPVDGLYASDHIGVDCEIALPMSP